MSTLHDAIQHAAGIAAEKDRTQVVGRIQGEWKIADLDDEGRCHEMMEPKFRVNGCGVDQGHIDRGEITEDWEIPGATRIEYVVKESAGRFFVQHTDENGETWDADPEGFDTEAEAESFRAEIQAEEDGK